MISMIRIRVQSYTQGEGTLRSDGVDVQESDSPSEKQRVIRPIIFFIRRGDRVKSKEKLVQAGTKSKE